MLQKGIHLLLLSKEAGMSPYVFLRPFLTRIGNSQMKQKHISKSTLSIF